jgi:hypothetical protein
MHRMMAAPSTDDRPIVGDIPVMQRLTHDYEDMFFQHGVRQDRGRAGTRPAA